MIKQLIITMLIIKSAVAVEISENFTIHGFTTFDITLNKSEDTNQYLPNGENNPLKQNEFNYNYSLIGAQFEGDITDTFDVMFQSIYSKQENDENYIPSIEWALFGYDIGNNYKLRAGKLKIPFMKGTELRYIGFSRLWTRPQISPIGVNGFDSMYGIELLKNSYINDIDLEFQVTAGQAEHISSLIDNNHIYNIALQASYEASWVHFSFGQISFNRYQKDGSLLNKNVALTFASIESEVHFNELIFYGGYGYNTNDAIPDDRFYYLSLSYELNKFIPYVLYSDRYIKDMPISVNSVSLKNGYSQEKHHSLGMRYNITETVDIKVLYDYKSYFKYKNNPSDKTIYSNIYTFAIDVMF